jgi:DNA-binding transcriptional LysR family regulator
MLLNEMEIFYYVVELKSFSKTAEKLGVAKSHISKKVTALKESLSAQLLTRSTRKLNLTEAGELFYKRCAQVVCEAENGFAQIRHLKDKPRGRLRLSIPPALGNHMLTPLFQRYMQRYPEVTLEIELENRVIDLVAEGIDLAIRSATMASSSLVATKLFTVKNILCATPSYINTHGVIKKPEQLAAHLFATYRHKRTIQSLTLYKDKKEIIAPIKSTLACNQIDFLKAMVLSGNCVAVFPEFMVEKELTDGRLLHCLPNYSFSSSDAYAIFPNKEFLPPKVRVLIEMLKELA